ncbi:P-II family nitrogen regulator [Desulfocurvibacter africanus]|uniref:P-II family nitrogen regulator n=1 Tax=Desulfocurvibacter africanus TaxID=873 RepID=UPI002FD90AC6
MSNPDFSLVVAIVQVGHSNAVIKIAQGLGAGGGTIVFGRGSSVRSASSILGVSVEPGKELIYIVAKKSIVPKLMQLVTESCNLNEPGTGLIFSLPLEAVSGLDA